MITKAEKKKLTIHLKNNWVDEVSKTLKKNGVTNRKGNAYSQVMIYKVLDGREHPEIENAILKVYEARKTEFDKLQERKQRILSA